MAMDSRSIPVFVGLLVLLVVGVFVVGRGVLPPSGPTQPTPAVQPSVGASNEPDNLHPQLQAGRASALAGQLDVAKTQLAQVPESDVGYLLALNDLGIVHHRLGESREALAAFTRILKVQPENPFALFGVCNSMLATGDMAGAELKCLRVLEIQPRHARARFTLGLIRVARGDLVLGVDAYLRAVAQHKNDKLIGQAAVDLDSYSAAHPEMAEPHYAMAVLARFLTSHNTEREELEKYLELAPDGVAAANAKEKLDELAKSGF